MRPLNTFSFFFFFLQLSERTAADLEFVLRRLIVQYHCLYYGDTTVGVFLAIAPVVLLGLRSEWEVSGITCHHFKTSYRAVEFKGDVLLSLVLSLREPLTYLKNNQLLSSQL